MLVVGGDVADALVEPDGVVVRPQPVHFEFELAGSLIFSGGGNSPLRCSKNDSIQS
jgi:hypothetical protein